MSLNASPGCLLQPWSWELEAEIPLLGLYIQEEEPAHNLVSPDSPSYFGNAWGNHFGSSPSGHSSETLGPCFLIQPAYVPPFSCSPIFKIWLPGDSGHPSTF